jgi:site-specific recombinase XerD
MTPDYRPSLVRSFERHLRAENRSEHTIASYLESLRQAEAFLAGRGRSLVDARREDLEAFLAGRGRSLADARREDLEAFLGELLQRRAPETVATRYRRLRVLYRWLEEEEEIVASPMARMKPPIVPDQPVPVVPEDGLRRLLGACAGKEFEARRDTAIVMFLRSSGLSFSSERCGSHGMAWSSTRPSTTSLFVPACRRSRAIGGPKRSAR